MLHFVKTRPTQIILFCTTLLLCASVPIDPIIPFSVDPVQPDAGNIDSSTSPTDSSTTTPIILPAIGRSTLDTTCSLPDLAPWQHVTANGSYEDSETIASSPMVCQIPRDSCAYNKLIKMIDVSIIFDGQETVPFNEEDALIHPTMLMPTIRLNRLIKAEWGGEYQLRITEAYDSLLEHDPPESEPHDRYSLHYEGRAIDLTLWPINRNLYGRLCALAHCAGFDYVEHEITHCHASIEANSLCESCAE